MIEEQNYKYIYIYHTWKKIQKRRNQKLQLLFRRIFSLILGWFWPTCISFFTLNVVLAILQLLQVTPFQIERLTMIPNSGRRKGSTPVDLNRRNGSADPVDLRRRNGSADPLYLSRRNGSADPVDLSRRNGSADPVDRINISEEPYLR